MSLSLAACAHVSPEGATNGGSGQSIPHFTGPYAKEIAEDYASASDYFKAVIVDEQVSDAEYQEARERAAQCWRDNGFTGIKFFARGGGSVEDRSDMPVEQWRKIYTGCEEKAGLIDTEIWYWKLRTNPDNVDWPAAERDCLVQAGFLEKGSSVADMNRWYDSADPRVSSPETHECASDPLHLLDDSLSEEE
ncbi:hypothetical protein [Schaalia sp. lx-100]|uniref:hypothetical protein n=1 Tax=Schaalia sp. lx-100 TaxID=2899081 RepID=UPI001E48BCD7|nr:hypothetical protein [Schaalia sp. lx-100]MCD4558113.1 hypothetical protein [Schaalia sp. lx-100]